MEEIIKIEISERLGEISAIPIIPENPNAIIVLAHGAGAGMTHAFMQTLAEVLAANQIATVRYNFPYTEKGKRRPDPPAIAEKTVQRVAEKVNELYSEIPLFLAGKSFGGRMSSQKISKECPPFVKGIIFYGFPLHAIGKPSMDRADHLQNVSVPMLFLQGSKDKLATLELIREVVGHLSPAKLVEFEGADHSFKVKKEIIINDLVAATKKWLSKIDLAF